MADPLLIPPGDYDTVRIFHVTLPKAQVDAMEAASPPGIDPAIHRPGRMFLRDTAMQLLGVDTLLTKWTSLFQIEELADQPLAEYLIQHENLRVDQITPDEHRLNALTGYILVVLPDAFEGQGATLDLGDRLTLIGSYGFAAQLSQPALMPAMLRQAPSVAPFPRTAALRSPNSPDRLVLAVFALFALTLILGVLAFTISTSR